MSLEQILEQAANARSGYEMATFKEAGLPVYVLTLRILTLDRKPLGPIEEGVLRAVQAGLDALDDIVLFLGLPRNVLTPILASLNTAEQVNYSRAIGEANAKVTLTLKGRSTLAGLAITRPQERTVNVCFDALTKKLLLIAPEQLNKPRDMTELGRFEVPIGHSKRPEVEDISLQEFDRIFQQQRAGLDEKCELLDIRRVERRQLRYLDCVMVFYRNQAQRTNVDVAFWREDGPALEHETCFREIGGQDLVGAKVLAKQRADKELTQQSLAEQEDVVGNILIQPSPEAVPQIKVIDNTQSIPEGETVLSVLCHEHPALLRKALQSSEKRLLIISPWIRHQVINSDFIASLEVLLRKGVLVHIGYGLDEGTGKTRTNAAQNKLPITPEAERELAKLTKKYQNFKLVYVGNTHRKTLVSDDSFAVTTSFNWLSFKGDPSAKPRDEYGELFRIKRHVDKRYEHGMDLLVKGYSGPSSGVVCPSKKKKR